MDSISIDGIRCLCRVGVGASERRRRQRILADVHLVVNLRKAAFSDELKDSVDYQALEAKLRQAAQSQPFKLLERLAGALVYTALGFDDRIRSARVVVRKRPASMPRTGSVSVELYRRNIPE